MGRSPLGESHLVEGPDAQTTVCGLPRSSFPNDFQHVTKLEPETQCPTCGASA